MTQHIYLAPGNAGPTTRWQSAFPDGVIARVLNEIEYPDAPDQVFWLSGDEASWREQLGAIRVQRPEAQCVVVTLAPSRRQAAAALDSGARGYCHAFSTVDQYREVAIVVAHGGVWLGPDIMDSVMRLAKRFLLRDEADPPVLSLLSHRENEVARAVVSGMSNKEVSRQLGITERTVKAHLGAVFEKLGVRDRLQLVLKLSGRGS